MASQVLTSALQDRRQRHRADQHRQGLGEQRRQHQVAVEQAGMQVAGGDAERQRYEGEDHLGDASGSDTDLDGAGAGATVGLLQQPRGNDEGRSE